MNELRNEILETRKKLADLENKYCNTYPKCINTACALYSVEHLNHCSWSVLTEDCKEYLPEIS